MKAKTYQSSNGWTAPQSLSTFGIPVMNGRQIKYLGLEEFNFTEIYKQHKLAFIPAFSIQRNDVIDSVELFYYIPKTRIVPGATFHYATLKNVSQLSPLDIPGIRQNELAAMPAFVANNAAFRQNYGNLFNPAVQIWNDCFQSNIIVAQGVGTRFVVNVRYESIEPKKSNNIVPWNNLMFAGCLYN